MITLCALAEPAPRERCSRGDPGEAGIRHAFFTREGGVSEGPFAALNCGFGSGDAPERVAQNRAIATARLGLAADRLATVRQWHSAVVVTVAEPWRREAAPPADGLVTRIPGLALGVLTADCAPVLFADMRARIIGAAHAGWRGALGGVVEATIARMEALGAARADIRAGIGPCIGPLSYEVGPEFPAPFVAEDPASGDFFAPAPRRGHFLFDLAGYVAHRLRRAGVAIIACAPHDTLSEEGRFFSYRRACSRGERRYGRLLSAIALRDRE
ncbi:MAG TPA: peptidoglycan editing factor PgeF [Stellaceae bacterium]|nr:peptidoglycan editing factor PgeF [Stellaceae bacterium]